MFPPHPFHSLPEVIYIVSIYTANEARAKLSFQDFFSQECFPNAAEVFAINNKAFYSRCKLLCTSKLPQTIKRKPLHIGGVVARDCQ